MEAWGRLALAVTGLLCIIVQISASTLNLPPNISEELFCSGCKGTIKELDKLITTSARKNINNKIKDALGGVCADKRFTKYDHIPPKMVRSCKYILENYRESLEDLAQRHYSPVHDKPQPLAFLEKNFCRITTKACLQIEDRAAADEKQKQRANLDKDELKLNDEITKIPENAKYAKPVHAAHEKLETEIPHFHTSPVAEEGDEIEEESINAPIHENDLHMHRVHSEL